MNYRDFDLLSLDGFSFDSIMREPDAYDSIASREPRFMYFLNEKILGTYSGNIKQ